MFLFQNVHESPWFKEEFMKDKVTRRLATFREMNENPLLILKPQRILRGLIKIEQNKKKEHSIPTIYGAEGEYLLYV